MNYIFKQEKHWKLAYLAKYSTVIEDGSNGSIFTQTYVLQSYDAILMCTGYDVNLDYLDESLRNKILKEDNDLQLYKQVFCPELGSRMAFVGFIQPSSGGIMMCSEVQVSVKNSTLS